MVNFLDLFILDKMKEETVMNSFCGEINSSFFETASYLGTMQTKGLVRIEAGIGRSVVNRTGDGEDALARARLLAGEPLDELDYAIIRAIAAGAKSPEQIGAELNVFEEDIALHLWRLVQQGYVKASIANVKVTLALSEAGFKLASISPLLTKSAEVQTTVPLEPVPLTPEMPEIGPPIPIEEQMKEAIIKGPDITTTAALAEAREEEIEFTPLYIFRAKLGYYFKKFVIVIAVIATAVVVMLALRTFGYI